MAEAPAAEDKKAETETKRGHDAAYTINHAIACTATDFAAPLISHQVAKKIFHSHSSVWQWFLGEGIGDIAAVPATIAIEELAPGLTGSVRKGMEKTLGWAFRKSARREAQSWARKNGLAPDSAEAKGREQQVYSYEIEHLPQAAIWTATSMVFNIATQKMFHKGMHQHGHDHGHSVLELAGSLIVGKAVSTGAVIGFRAAFPEEARGWDDFSARHVFAPLSRATDSILGRRPREDGWADRVSENAAAPQAATGRA